MQYFYPAVFKYNHKKQYFIAIFPDINGCRAQGSSIEEIVSELKENLCAYLWELEEREMEIPTPSMQKEVQMKYRSCSVITVIADMEKYREYREYKVRYAHEQARLWAEEANNRRHSSIFSRVFGIR